MKELYQMTRELKRLREAQPKNETEKKNQKIFQERMEKQCKAYIGTE